MRRSVHCQCARSVGEDKYDATTASMIALLRYGSGFPWNRLADLEERLGIPLPVATQCEMVPSDRFASPPLPFISKTHFDLRRLAESSRNNG